MVIEVSTSFCDLVSIVKRGMKSAHAILEQLFLLNTKPGSQKEMNFGFCFAGEKFSPLILHYMTIPPAVSVLYAVQFGPYLLARGGALSCVYRNKK